MNLINVLYHPKIVIEPELLLHLQLKDEDLLILVGYGRGVIFDVIPRQNHQATQVELLLSLQEIHKDQDFVSNNSILQKE